MWRVRRPVAWLRRTPVVRRALVSLLLAYFFLSIYIYRKDSIAASLSHNSNSQHVGSPSSGVVRSRHREKELIVASLKGDNVTWLEEFFPDWKANVYIVNNDHAKLTVMKNKGREAMPFLT